MQGAGWRILLKPHSGRVITISVTTQFLNFTKGGHVQIRFALSIVLLTLGSNIVAAGEQDGPWAVHGDIVSVAGASAGWVVFDDSGVSALHCLESDIPPNARKLKH